MHATIEHFPRTIASWAAHHVPHAIAPVQPMKQSAPKASRAARARGPARSLTNVILI